MKPIDFELERRIRAPIDKVFARLVDIDGHNAWMAHTGSMLKHTRQTSPGKSTVGTTFVDETSQGQMPGEIAALEAPHTVVFHWWEKSASGKLKFEGGPSYHLEAVGDSETVVRHRAKLMAYGAWRLGAPLWRRLAVKERTITVRLSRRPSTIPALPPDGSSSAPRNVLVGTPRATQHVLTPLRCVRRRVSDSGAGGRMRGQDVAGVTV